MRPLTSLALLAVAAAANAQGTFAITNARIVTEPGKAIETGTVLIRDGKIAEVGRTVKTDGATVLDGKGLTVYAGFIDAYTTAGLKLPEAPAAQPPRVANERAYANMWHENRRDNRADLIAANHLDLESRLKAAHENGITAAMLGTGSGMFRGSTSVVKMQKDAPVLVKQFGQDMAIRSAGGFGGGGGGGGGNRGYPGSLMGFTALFRQALYDAQNYSGAPKDNAMAALKEVVDGKQMAVYNADTSREIFRAIGFAKEFNLKLVIQGAREGADVLEDIKASGAPVIARIDVGEEPSLKAASDTDETPQEVRDERLDTWKFRAANVPALMKAGITVAFTSGIGGQSSFLEGIRKVMEYGLSEDDALRGLTVNAAKILGIADRVGTIAPGKDADLVVMTGPLKDKESKIKWVFVNGNKVEVAQ